MRKLLSILMATIAAAFFAGCSNNGGSTPPDNNAEATPKASELSRDFAPGVCLTFDDRNIGDWEAMLDTFERYNAHVTFFINGPIGEAEATRLKAIAAHGHTIGAHGLKHDIYSECKKKGMTAQEYAAYDSLGQLEDFKKLGIDVAFYACPSSSRDAELDEVLKPYFKHIRTGIFPKEGQRLCDMDNAFVPAKELSDHFCLNGKGIDKYPSNTQEMVDDAMARAAQRGELIVFYAHRITSEPINNNHIEPAEVERILQKGKELGLRFYSFAELP